MYNGQVWGYQDQLEYKFSQRQFGGARSKRNMCMSTKVWQKRSSKKVACSRNTQNGIRHMLIVTGGQQLVPDIDGQMFSWQRMKTIIIIQYQAVAPCVTESATIISGCSLPYIQNNVDITLKWRCTNIDITRNNNKITVVIVLCS